jgi:hypothetical protein
LSQSPITERLSAVAPSSVRCLDINLYRGVVFIHSCLPYQILPCHPSIPNPAPDIPTPLTKSKKRPTYKSQVPQHNPWYHMHMHLRQILTLIHRFPTNPAKSKSGMCAQINKIKKASKEVRRERPERPTSHMCVGKVETPRKCYAVVCACWKRTGVRQRVCMWTELAAYFVVPWEEGDPRLEGWGAGALVIEVRF